MIRAIRHVFLAVGAVTFIGCAGDALTDPVPSLISPEDALWALTANYTAVNLALVSPFNTVQLHVTPYNARGDSIPLRGAIPTYTTLDTIRIHVTPDGLVTAKTTGSNIVIVASLQIGTITQVDTILVKITATAPVSPLATFSIQPGDSARWSWGGDGKRIVPVARNVANGNLSALQVGYEVSNTRIAKIAANGITNATLTGKTTGRVWVRASVYAYGVSRQDSVEYIIGYPINQIINVDRVSRPDGTVGVAFYPSTVTITVGGTVFWDYRGQWIGVQGPGLIFGEPEAARAPFNCIFGTGAICSDPMLFDTFKLDVRNGNAEPRPIYTSEGSGISSVTATLRSWHEPGVYTFRDHWGQKTGTVIVKSSADL